MKLENGATPIMAVKDMQTQFGMVDATGLVLARYRDQWVVWDIGKDAEEEAWHCAHGDYFDLEEQAKYMFGIRLKRLLTTKENSGIVRGFYAQQKVGF